MRINTCGHPERKHHALGLCYSCYKGTYKSRERRAYKRKTECEHTDREHYSNGMCKSCYKQDHLFFRYNITREQYDELLSKQDGHCAFPGCTKAQEIGGNFLAVDHDHKCCPGRNSCGKCVRGILCMSHNTLIDWVEQFLRNPEAEDWVKSYLKLDPISIP